MEPCDPEPEAQFLSFRLPSIQIYVSCAPNLTQTGGELQVQTLRRIVTATDLETAKSMAEATLGRLMQMFAETV